MIYYFYGVNVAKDRRVGYINSEELIKGLEESWFPFYQRERIMRKRKIDDLTTIFKTGAPIDSIKLNLVGTIQDEGEEALLDGTFHVIDGQQRLRALKDSMVRGYKVPVELYVNLTMDKEVELFHQYNSAGTELSFGEFAKSYEGPMAEYLRTILEKFPVPLAINSSKAGMTLSAFCPLMLWVHRKAVLGHTLQSTPTGARLKSFLQDPQHTVKDIELLDYALRNVAKSFVEMWGTYDVRSTAYRRSFFLAWNHIVINSFLTPVSKVDFSRFRGKLESRQAILQNARVRELLGGGSGYTHEALYDAIVDFFNNKLKGNRLRTYREQEITGNGRIQSVDNAGASL